MKSCEDKTPGDNYIKILLYPMPLRIFHWILVPSLSLAIISGLTKSLAIPLFTMKTGRLVHLSSGLVALAITLYRVGFSIISRDYKNYIPKLKDFETFPAFIKYYLFIDEAPPAPLPKYNIGQKITMMSWLLSILYLAGVGLLAYNGYLADRFPALKLQRLILPQQLLVTKFYLSLYLTGTIFLHIYLAHTEDIGKTQSIFTGWVRARRDRIKK